MELAGLGAVTSATLLVAALIASAIGLFWATTALERWLDAAPNHDTAAPLHDTATPMPDVTKTASRRRTSV